MESELYTTLEREASAEFEEKKSLFIGYAAPVRSEEEAQAFIRKIQKKHSDATHNVYGYLMKNCILARYSDDGEPQGTAGMPVLDTIRKSGVDDACVVVTRYFGGTLLGAGGLVRAYAHAAKIALEAAHIITYEKYAEMSLDCSYSAYQKYLVELPRFGAVIDDTVYAEGVTVKFIVKKTLSEKLLEKVSEMSGGKDIPVILGERFDFR